MYPGYKGHCEWRFNAIFLLSIEKSTHERKKRPPSLYANVFMGIKKLQKLRNYKKKKKNSIKTI